MATSDVRLWKIVRVSGVTAIMFGLYYFVLPPAWSSAMVKALQKAPPEEQFKVAGSSISSLLWTIGGIQILHGAIVIICAGKGLKRANSAH